MADDKQALIERGLREALVDAVNHLYQVARSNYGHGAIEKFETGLEHCLKLYDECFEVAGRMLKDEDE